jgi:hypothetical protein
LTLEENSLLDPAEEKKITRIEVKGEKKMKRSIG